MKQYGKDPLIPRLAVIKGIVQETRDSFSLDCVMSGDVNFSFRPGQFNMLGAPGVGEAPLSFSSLPWGRGGFTHTIRRVGNVTHAISRLKMDDTLHIRGPYGTGWPLKRLQNKNVVIVAGGIGMAPLRPVVHRFLKGRKRHKKLYLLYGVRTMADVLYKKELESWSALENVYVLLSVDEKPRKKFLGAHTGMVTDRIHEIDAPLDNAITLICGPEIMMRLVARQVILKGQDPRDVFVSMERRMKCGIGHCGHCQIGAVYVCKDGPVFSYLEIKRFADTLL